MSQKHNIFHGQFVPQADGTLVPATRAIAERYNLFKKDLTLDQKVEVFMEANIDNATVPQIAKIHVCIRELSMYTGNSFEDTKLEIKKLAGLCVEKTIDGSRFLICKSFGDCSKEELALAIEAIIQVGDGCGINFR